MAEQKEVMLTDRVSDFEKESTRTYTKEGFLRVKGRVARSGIQDYYGFELGLKDEAYKRKRLFRPADVVLSDEACALYEGVDVTLGHPKDFVNAKTYRQLSSGVVVGRAIRDSENPNFIVCDMLIKDAETIKAIEAGRIGLSVGYANTIDFTPGTTPDGEPYDARVDAITRVNHVALVDRPRAGAEARVFDAEGGAMKTINIGDQAVEMADEVADLIESHIKSVESRAQSAEDAVKLKDEEKAELEAQIEGLKTELEDARSQILSDEDIQQVVKTAAELHANAKIIAGDTFVCDSVDPLTIMKSALEAGKADIDLSDADESFIKGAFAVAVASAKKASEQQMNDSQKRVSGAFGSSGGKAAEPQKTADQLYKERASEAWKTSPARQ